MQLEHLVDIILDLLDEMTFWELPEYRYAREMNWTIGMARVYRMRQCKLVPSTPQEEHEENKYIKYVLEAMLHSANYPQIKAKITEKRQRQEEAIRALMFLRMPQLRAIILREPRPAAQLFTVTQTLCHTYETFRRYGSPSAGTTERSLERFGGNWNQFQIYCLYQGTPGLSKMLGPDLFQRFLRALEVYLGEG